MIRAYLVSYDITEDRRLRKVFSAMRGFGEHIQYSVFRCELSPRGKVIMIDKLSKIIDHREDQILIVDLGPVEGHGSRDCIESIGRAYARNERHAIII